MDRPRAGAAATRGCALVLPAGTEAERARSGRIAAALPHARVPDRQPLDSMAQLIAGASFVIGVDTGLLHLAAAARRAAGGDLRGQRAGPGTPGRWRQGPITVVGGKNKLPSVPEVTSALERLL